MKTGTSKFNVSIVIPVYNAVTYIRRAVESAAVLKEVGEILLIEDNSTDNSLFVCRQIEGEYSTVKLFQHSDKGNHGPGASRNIGIINASCEFIAFLDADDYYLPNRFEQDKNILLECNDIDGVYNAIGTHYYSEKGKKVYLEGGHPEILTVSGMVPPDELIFVLLWCHPNYHGSFHTDTITVRKQLFNKVGLFNPYLLLQQDTHMWHRMAATGRLAPGSISEPVAIRGVHDNNRMTKKYDQNKYHAQWWADLYRCFKSDSVDKIIMVAFEQKYCEWKISIYPGLIKHLSFLIHIFKNPYLIVRKYEFFDLNLFYIFGKNWITLHFVSAKNRFFRKTKNSGNHNPT